MDEPKDEQKYLSVISSKVVVCPNCKQGVMSDLGYWTCPHCFFECSYREMIAIKTGDDKLFKMLKESYDAENERRRKK
jgi:hypothetical protein